MFEMINMHKRPIYPKAQRHIFIVGNYSEKNCRKFYRGKILRKIS
jgi:hypothetical protein